MPYSAGGAFGGAPATGNVTGPAGSCPVGSCYPTGQCTAYVATIYPVFQKMGPLGNACQWWNQVLKYNWQHTSNPYAGAVVVFDCSLPGSGGDGHVGIVSSVNKDGSFNMTSMNWVGWDRVDTHPVTSRSHIQGFFTPPGGVNQNFDAANAAAAAGPATGARGLKCQFAFTFPRVPLTPQNVGPVPVPTFEVGGWNVCFDGLIGVLAIAGGLGIMALSVFLFAKPYAERAAGGAAKVAGVATAQPEVAAAGEAVEQQGQQTAQARRQAQIEARTRAAQARGEQTRAAFIAQHGVTPESSQGIQITQARRSRSRRPRTADHMSVQEQETHKFLMGAGYSSVQASRGARAAGSQGTAQERVRRGLRALAPQR